MGYAVPAAIGAAIVHPDRCVIGFVGDGGMLMTGQEIATAFHHSVAPIIMVFNNQMYGTIRMHQEKTFPGRVSGTALTNPDFARFIESFGGHGELVERTDDLVPAFERARASGKPAVIEVRTDPEQITNRSTIAQLREQARRAAEGRSAEPRRTPHSRPRPGAPRSRGAPARACAEAAVRDGSDRGGGRRRPGQGLTIARNRAVRSAKGRNARTSGAGTKVAA